MLLLNPFTGKLVDVSEEFVDQLSRAGFKEQEPEVVEPVKVSAPPTKRPARKPRK
jgi:hypothetical protein